ncbi:hypothetical protein GCM10020219_006960 [Nonomuraea dietziae]
MTTPPPRRSGRSTATGSSPSSSIRRLRLGALVEKEYGQDPNRARMNETQFNAYKKAEDACMAKAFKVVR